jgi:hypothetical protein
MHIVLSDIKKACEKFPNYCFFLNKQTFADRLLGNVPFGIGSHAIYIQNNLMLTRNGLIIFTMEPETGQLSLAEILDHIQT